MRVGIVSTSILLLAVLSRVAMEETSTVVTADPETTVIDETTAPPTDPETTPPEDTTTPAQPAQPPQAEPTTEAPIPTTVSNENITIIDDKEAQKFLESCNRHREQHLMGRYGYVWTWDPSLVQSATARILPSCTPKIDNSDERRELLLTAEDWHKIKRDKKTLRSVMVTVTYEKGSARVGCVMRKGCGDKGADFVYFCHFAPSKFSPDPDFNKPVPDCQYDEKFSGLCIDAPIRPTTSERPIRIVYVKAASGFNIIMVFGMILGMSWMT